MRTANIAVVSAGLSVPSSTRLLADRLAAATVDGPARPRDRRRGPGRRAARARPRPGRPPGHRLPQRRPAATRSTPSPAPTALIAVTPIFAASYSGLFKTFFDVIEEDALAGKPVLLGATAGTARHSLALDHALRPLFAYLRTDRGADRRARRDGRLGRRRGVSRGLAERIDRAGGELADLVAGRPRSAKADPFADVVPFEALLHRV